MSGDAARVHQIVSNLLTNAMKFTPAGGRVGLPLETRATRAVIEAATVETAEGGEDGLRVAERMRPDIVLCDIGLPDIDGFEVARRMRVRADLGDTRLIALTGYGQAEDMRQALEAGFEAHLTKPVNLEQLIALLVPASR